jgi:hypothetical protein
MKRGVNEKELWKMIKTKTGVGFYDTLSVITTCCASSLSLEINILNHLTAEAAEVT